MKKIIEYLKNNKISAFSLFLGLLGVLLAIIFYFFPSNLKNIQYSIQNYTLFKDYVQQVDGMQISINGENVKNLTVSNIVIWNSGHSIIEYEDIPAKNPLCIKLLTNESKIISAKILHQTNIGNDSQITIREDNFLQIGFEYLDKNDGFVLQIIHTENNLSSENIFGEIKGIGQIKNKYNLLINRNRNISFITIFLIVIYFVLFFMVYGNIRTNIKSKFKDFLLRTIFTMAFALLLLLLVLFFVFLLSFIGRATLPISDSFKIGVPNELQKYFIQ
jgi:hypothetical protein